MKKRSTSINGSKKKRRKKDREVLPQRKLQPLDLFGRLREIKKFARSNPTIRIFWYVKTEKTWAFRHIRYWVVLHLCLIFYLGF